LSRRHQGKIVIDAVPPDCVGGWDGRSLTVTPSGRVLPCHAAEPIPDLTFWSVGDHALGDIWANSPAFNAFRGTDFLPHHGRVAGLAAVQQDTPYAYRRM
jgi:pyrroloquinoline quinone biosynthesis protein E